MKVSKNELNKLIKSINGVKYTMHFVAGCNNKNKNKNLGSVLYFSDMLYPDSMRFFKADVFSPDDIHNWNFGQKCNCEKTFAKTFYDFTETRKIKNPNINFRRDFLQRNPNPATPINEYEDINNDKNRYMFVGGNLNQNKLSFDDFLNKELIKNMQYSKKIKVVNGGNIEGNVIYYDDYIDVPINYTKAFYYNPYGAISNKSNRLPCLNPAYDLTDYVLLKEGVSPYRNRCFKRLIAFNLMKELENEGLNIVKNNNKYIIPIDKTVGGKSAYQKYWDKLIRSVKKTGKKIEKSFTEPIRKYLKKNAPALWKAIEKIDKSLGFTKITKKYGKELEKLGQKYGAKLMETAIMVGSQYVASQVGVDPNLTKQAISMAVKTYDNITDKDKGQLENILNTATYINSPDVQNVFSRMFSATENAMQDKEKNKEQLNKDLGLLKNIFTDMYTEAVDITGIQAGELVEKVKKPFDFINNTNSINLTEVISNFEPLQQAILKGTIGCFFCLI